MFSDFSCFKANIIWNAPYSPVFNPIEEFFGTLKKRL